MTSLFSSFFANSLGFNTDIDKPLLRFVYFGIVYDKERKRGCT
jgi:hypothetical protein